MATTLLEEYARSFQDDTIDSQFKDTYDEVLALKEMLEEFLDTPKEKDTNTSVKRTKQQSPPSNHARIKPVNFQCGSIVQSIQQESSKHITKSKAATIFGSSSQSQITVEQIPLKHLAMEDKVNERCDDDNEQKHHEKYQEESYGEIRPKDVMSEVVAEENDSQIDQNSRNNSGNNHVNRNSMRLLRNSLTYRPNFHHRIAYYKEKNRQEKEFLRKRIQEIEDEQLTWKPTINEKSKTLRRSLSDLNVWATHRQNKLEHLRSLEMKRQETAHPGRPSIDEHSIYLFETRHDELSKCKVEDRLHLLGLIYEYQQETKQLEEAKQRQASYSFHPQLAPHSRNISTRSENVHERLYGLASTQQSPDKNNEELRKKKRQDNIRSHKEQTQAVEKLYATAEIYRQHRHDLAEKMELQRQQLRNESKFSEKSRKLLSKQRARSASPDRGRRGVKSRVLTSIQGGTQEASALAQSHRLERCKGHCSSKAKTAPSPPKRQVTARNATALYERQMRWKEMVDLQRADKRRQREKQALAECTFKNPLYHSQWCLEMKISSSDEVNKVEDDFYQRSIRWMKARDAAVEEEKKLWSEIEVQECTFKPKTINYNNKSIKKEDDKASSTGATAASSLTQSSLSSNNEDSPSFKRKGKAFPRPSPTRISRTSNKNRSKPQVLQNKTIVRLPGRDTATQDQTSTRYNAAEASNKQKAAKKHIKKVEDSSDDRPVTPEEVYMTPQEQEFTEENAADQKARHVIEALADLANKLGLEEEQEAAEYTAYSSPERLNGDEVASDEGELIHQFHDAQTYPLLNLNSPLPTGWEEYFTSEGYPYYHNAKLNLTQWEFPLL